jgi:predicted ATP-dependent endonuclease of OLD family
MPAAKESAVTGSFGLGRVRVRGFRSARDVSVAPGPLCALVGEAGSGKSNLLSAIWRLLSASAPPLEESDLSAPGDGRLLVEASIGKRSLSLEERASEAPVRGGEPPPALFLPAALRSDEVVASATALSGAAARVLAHLAPRAGTPGRSAAAPALALIAGLEACCAARTAGVVLLVEEPELYLRPQAQRYLYRLLREFAVAGNQVLYSTHAPAFLNVARLEELALVEHRPPGGTTVVQPEPLPADESFRALSEFDAERSELFLARAVLLVEGRTEKLVFPFVFRALGHDADREAISIVECGGKPNIPLFARICAAVGLPYVVVHDRDAPPGRKPIAAECAVNAEIARIAGPERTVVLEPDFEAVAGLVGHSHKPERAWRSFATGERPVPAQLTEAVERALRLGRG